MRLSDEDDSLGGLKETKLTCYIFILVSILDRNDWKTAQ